MWIRSPSRTCFLFPEPFERRWRRAWAIPRSWATCFLALARMKRDPRPGPSPSQGMRLPSDRTIQVVTDHDTDQAGPINQEILSIWRELRPEIEKLAVEEATIYAWDARWRWGRHAPVRLKGAFHCLQFWRRRDGSWVVGSRPTEK